MAAMICTTCNTTGKPKTVTRGSLIIELALWILCLVPGLIYSLWRLSTRAKVCRACGSPQIVPVDSPVGRRLSGHG